MKCSSYFQCLSVVVLFVELIHVVESASVSSLMKEFCASKKENCKVDKCNWLAASRDASRADNVNSSLGGDMAPDKPTYLSLFLPNFLKNDRKCKSIKDTANLECITIKNSLGTRNEICASKTRINMEKNKNPSTCQKTNELDLVDIYFTHRFGVHLTDGAHNFFVHDVTLLQCSLFCLNSASKNGVPCLSFDYYPAETATDPQSCSSGMCVLHSETARSARLRYEDEGFTVSELFYSVHFTKRPNHPASGYYEYRSPSNPDNMHLMPLNSWNVVSFPGSFDGAVRLQALQKNYQRKNENIHEIKAKVKDACRATPSNSVESSSIFAFSPIDENGHVVNATSLSCGKYGARLCNTKDYASVNHVMDASMCCVAIRNPPSVLDSDTFCGQYTSDKINKCATYTSYQTCTRYGSFSHMAQEWGNGSLTKKLQKHEDLSILTSQIPIESNKLKTKGRWISNDACIWCPSLEENGGACVPGNDWGVCPTSSREAQERFLKKIVENHNCSNWSKAKSFLCSL